MDKPPPKQTPKTVTKQPETGFEDFVRAAMATGKPPKAKRKAKRKAKK